MPERNWILRDSRIRFATRFLAKRCCSSMDAVDEVVAALHLSPSRFRHLFKQETGSSPAQYVKRLRLRYARQLLEDSSLSVKEVMAAIGMNDFSHFVRDFKALHGMTPLQARRLHIVGSSEPGQRQQEWPTDSQIRQDDVMSITERATKLPSEPS